MSDLVDPQAYEYITGQLEHKRLVGLYLSEVVKDLALRGVKHDFSKFSPEELEPYAQNQDNFKRVEYGTPEYKACFDNVKPALKHHFAHNSHHPEFYPDGINDMDLFDVMEMVCDWLAACQRNGGDTLRLDLQRERFGISDQLYGIICSTAEKLAAGSKNPIKVVR